MRIVPRARGTIEKSRAGRWIKTRTMDNKREERRLTDVPTALPVHRPAERTKAEIGEHDSM